MVARSATPCFAASYTRSSFCDRSCAADTAAGFGNWFRDRCNEAGLRHCSFHGLRKAAATRLIDAGCGVVEVAAITGHASLKEQGQLRPQSDQTSFLVGIWSDKM